MSKIDLRQARQIHLDFHTPGFVTVGDRFDAKRFFDTLEGAAVNAISVFAKCHHGYSYFDTEVGTKHPGLDFDLLGAMCAEGESRGIDLLPYFSFAVDEVYATAHPECVAQFRDGSPVDIQVMEDGSELFWKWMCPNRGDWVESFFLPHVREVLERYPCQGIFIDMAGHLPGSCLCPECRARAGREGVNLDNEPELLAFNAHVMQEFARRLREVMNEYDTELRLEIGCFNRFGDALKAQGVISDFYIESLPIQRGWFFFPMMARYLRNQELPVVGYTGRFLKSWGDFGTVKSAHQMKLEVSTHLAAGVACGIGDHMHCSGYLEPKVYEVIGEAFRFAAARQPYVASYEPVREMAVLAPTTIEGNTAAATRSTGGAVDRYGALLGASKWMMESHYQWDVITRENTLEGFGALVVPHGDIPAAMVGHIDTFVQDGGLLIACFDGLEADDPVARDPWRELLGIEATSMSEHPGSFYRALDERINDGLGDMAHYAHGASMIIEPAVECQTLADTWYSPCIRSRDCFYGHFHGPATEKGPAAVTARKHGKGHVVLVSHDLFNIFPKTGYVRHRMLLDNIVGAFVDPARRVLRTNAPGVVEVTAGRKDGRIVLQLVPFVVDRRHREAFESASEPVAISGIELQWLPESDVQKVYDPLSDREIDWSRDDDGSIRIRMPEVSEHTLVLME